MVEEGGLVRGGMGEVTIVCCKSLPSGSFV